ncbi:membrane-associated ribonuclease BN-like (Rbn) [[Clostridium] sordellii]|uniref:Membrane-associated ribonuclease BN-like (Rbn) n=2 Tax=Paraclostridium sordellii TaxID=1505 RepID=A0A9P1L058_PARSO|nr:YihY/virulence factor BrkB family protein [Paeniclostridium sordellii]EPZ55914.1 yihY family inner membrane domain protein [[Clostridium] sordellii VPI 9048] [Paeniclostridium sordellii VPI 9048]MCH1966454.1 YihY/virulence factor BrkB family protein [Paeniclostridium sordellii]MCQ4696993.1 YihY/virulence factor BrkB family protein [Paeniclostridium sordellii]MCR1848179.1 YihY/virulence factor BrkB family protein [Paeniclostridium sordellii]MDU2147745.1 YihY/virulence factor BrkB family prot
MVGLINNIKNSIKSNVQNSIIYKRINLNDINSRAAAMSYYLLLSIFPFLIFMINLLGFIPIIHINKFLYSFDDLIPRTAFIMVQSIIDSAVSQKSISLTVMSFTFTLWSSSRAVRVFIKGINKSYNVLETRSFLKLIIISFYFTVELIVLIVSSMVFLLYGEKVGYLIFKFLGLSKIFIPTWNLFRYSFVIAITIWIVSSLFRYGPNKKIPLIEAMPGAILSIFGWILVSVVFSFYTNNFSNYQVIYGSIGGIIALLTWFYLSSWIMLLGCEINALIYYRRQRY